jgi:hypothetical protein
MPVGWRNLPQSQDEDCHVEEPQEQGQEDCQQVDRNDAGNRSPNPKGQRYTRNVPRDPFGPHQQGGETKRPQSS